MTSRNNNPIVLISDKQERFAYYHIDEYRIGCGAMGEVFKGWKVDRPAEKIAIKRVFPRHSQNSSIRERARFEASLSIDHPNLIKMLGYSQMRDGSIYIISEFVQGNTIDKFVQTIHPSNRVEIISRMMCLVLDALTCLHQQRVWHRDIKPSNIMVENGCNVRVMDLGIATSDGISFGTIADRGFGTYPYAPPEQITGKRDQINATSDLYSLGITFYELLAGINPFAGGSDIDVLERQVKMSLPYDPAITKSLFNVLLKATAKKQLGRFQTAKEFKEAIIKANTSGEGYNPIQWKLIVLVAVAVLILLILIVSII
ncbi:MAG: serine/threonine-protein kinase [Prolixibacteraceae bacterium]|jgi:serine/threonine-protein kinase